MDIEATPDETKKITGANLKSQVLVGHKDLTTGVHGVGAQTINDPYDILMSRPWAFIWWAGNNEIIVGTGTIRQMGSYVELNTGNTINSKARCWGIPYRQALTDHRIMYDVVIYVLFTTATKFAMGYLRVTEDPYAIEDSFGIEVVDNALYAFSCDNTTRSTLDLATTLVVALYSIRQQLIDVNGTRTLKTWVNGVAKADKTTNMPRAAQAMRAVSVELENTAAADKRYIVYVPKFVYLTT